MCAEIVKKLLEDFWHDFSSFQWGDCRDFGFKAVTLQFWSQNLKAPLLENPKNHVKNRPTVFFTISEYMKCILVWIYKRALSGIQFYYTQKFTQSYHTTWWNEQKSSCGPSRPRWSGRFCEIFQNFEGLQQARSPRPGTSIELPGYPDIGLGLKRSFLGESAELGGVTAPCDSAEVSRFWPKSICTTPWCPVTVTYENR